MAGLLVDYINSYFRGKIKVRICYVALEDRIIFLGLAATVFVYMDTYVEETIFWFSFSSAHCMFVNTAALISCLLDINMNKTF